MVFSRKWWETKNAPSARHHGRLALAMAETCRTCKQMIERLLAVSDQRTYMCTLELFSERTAVHGAARDPFLFEVSRRVGKRPAVAVLPTNTRGMLSASKKTRLWSDSIGERLQGERELRESSV